MLTTNSRTTQTLDPCTGVAPAAPVAAVECVRPRALATSATAGFAFTGNSVIDASWLANGRKPMPKVDLHPDRWPLHSTS